MRDKMCCLFREQTCGRDPTRQRTTRTRHSSAQTIDFHQSSRRKDPCRISLAQDEATVEKARVCNVPTGFWLSPTGRSTVIIAMGPLSCFDLPRLDEMRGDLFSDFEDATRFTRQQAPRHHPKSQIPGENDPTSLTGSGGAGTYRLIPLNGSRLNGPSMYQQPLLFPLLG